MATSVEGTSATPSYDVKDMGLAEQGLARIRWAEGQMPVLRSVRERFAREQPFAGMRIGACLHVTTETANLMVTLKAGGASIVLCPSNPLSTQDDVAAALVEAARAADIIITVTGDLNVIDKQHFEAMKDGCIVANSGHFNDEINIPALAEMTRSQRTARPFVEEYELHDGRRIYLLADGRLLNLASAEGHPAAVMDMSFANQALSAMHIAQHHSTLAPGVYDVPQDIDRDVARLKLESLGVRIDALTEEQRRYLASWDMGT